MMVRWATILVLVSGCAAEQADAPFTGPTLTRVECEAGDAATVYEDASRDALERSVTAVLHDYRYRNEVSVQVPVTFQPVIGGVQASAPCLAGGSYVVFSR